MPEPVNEHYTRTDIEDVVLTALADAGVPVDVDGLGTVDELHSGGRPATAAVTAQLGLTPSSHLLDVGCGIGGTARFVAATYGCRVTGIDLTAEFVPAARALTARVGLAERVEFRQASALALPFPVATFDAVCMLHVGMNIEHKDVVCTELGRVLRPGGTCVVYDVMRTGDGNLDFPVPWASTPDISFLADLPTYRDHLNRAGLDVTSTRDWTEPVLRAIRKAQESGAGPPRLGPQVLMTGFAVKAANVVDAMRRGVVAPVEVVTTRRG